MLWHGTLASIPINWRICDGNNGTPNLLARFIKGVATAVTDPGATGGAAAHQHTTQVHTHTYSHGHTVNGGADGGCCGGTEYNCGSLAGHIHNITAYSPTVADDSTSTSSDSNDPMCFEIAFVMKVS